MTGTASLLAKATLTLALALFATSLAPRSRAAIRHLLLAGAFGMLLILPVASAVAPTVHLRVPIAVDVRPSIAPSTVASADAFIGVVETPAVKAQPRAYGAWLPALLVAVWALGACLFLLRIAVGVWQMRRIRRAAAPWNGGQAIVDAIAGEIAVGRRVDALLTAAVPGPVTCGIVRHTIILPGEALSWTAGDLRRAVVHELEHVSRLDWLTHCVARAIAACYWFHPLVWIGLRRLLLEAERACDDAVLRRSDATEYARQLVSLAERMVDRRNGLRVAMASRTELPSRVHALLDEAQRRGRAGARWIALSAGFSTVVAAAMSTLQVGAASGATAEPPQRFEVASVKPCKDDAGGDGQRRLEWRVPSPGRVQIECVTVERIIYYAYVGVGGGQSPLLNVSPATPNVVRAGPAWMRSERFNIEAKADGAADRATMMGPMLQSLLEERFHLVTHRGREEAPMYALTVAKGGLKIRPIGDNGCTSPESVSDVPPGERFKIDSGPKPICGSWATRGDGINRTVFMGGQTMERLASVVLSAILDRFVIDRTGVAGRFNMQLTYGFDPGPNPAPSDIERGPSIFTALQEQLGLKLENTKGPREFLVVDRVERPDPD